MRLVTVALAFLALSCVTAPPVFIHSSTYKGGNFGKGDESFDDSNFLIVVPDDFKSAVEVNNARYVYGALCKRLSKTSGSGGRRRRAEPGRESRVKVIRRGEFVAGKFEVSGPTYAIELDLKEYGDRDVVGMTGGGEIHKQLGPTKCFELRVNWAGFGADKKPINGSTFTQFSRGCPGITDVRVLVPEILDTLHDKQFPNDTYITFEIPVRGGIYGNKFTRCDAVDNLLGLGGT